MHRAMRFLGSIAGLALAAACTPAGAQATFGSTNVALSSAGATATASSDYGAPFSSLAAVIDGDTSGNNWGNGGGWEDATYDEYPDWVQVTFAGMKSIDFVEVWTLRNNYGGGGSNESTLYGVVDFTIQGWNGSSWVTLGTVTGNTDNRPWRRFEPFTTDRILIHVTRAAYFKSRIVEIGAWGFASTAPALSNVALASAGATISASSDYGAPFSSLAAVINGDRAGASWGNGGGWEDGTHNAFPDWVQINFNGPKSVDHVEVYTLRDDVGNPSEPGDAQTFSLYGLVDFTVEGWNGSNWVPLGTVTNNNLVKRSVNFPRYITDRIRIRVTRGLYFKSRIVEIEAWAAPASAVSRNVALPSFGTTVSVSSDYGAPHSSPMAVMDGDRSGAAWGNGGGWEDGTDNAYPDRLTLTFDRPRDIVRVVVYTLRDNFGDPSEPTDTETFTQYGVVDFVVLMYNGGFTERRGTVVGNNLVKRSVDLLPGGLPWHELRIEFTRTQYFKTRVVEVEAWEAPR
jgi:hypothetical protein